MFEMLFKSGLDVNSKIAKEDLVRFLVDQGADLETSAECSDCIHEYGINTRSYENCKDLEFGEVGPRVLHVAAYAARACIVDFLIERGADVNAFGGTHGTALVAACSTSFGAAERLETVKILVENGAEICAEAEFGGSAMQAASFNGQAEVVAFLLHKGASVDRWGGEYGTALIAACCNDDEEEALETVKVLIDNGADVNYLGERHGNALYQAAFHGHYGAVRALIQGKANLNSWNDPLEAPLMATCHGQKDTMEIAKLMLDNGANINASRNLALKMASGRCSREMVRFLLDNGASLEANESGSNPLHVAVVHARADTADTLIASGVDVNSHDILLWTPF